MKNTNLERRIKRQVRVRSKIFGTKDKPRISVFRSNKYIYGQAIDDTNKKTILSFSSLNLKNGEKKLKGIEEAKSVGKELGKGLISKKIKEAVFDKGRYAYKGKVKNLCEGLREAGIKI